MSNVDMKSFLHRVDGDDFQIGDVVQFTSIYEFSDQCQLDRDYTVVEKLSKSGRFHMGGSEVDGYTGELTLEFALLYKRYLKLVAKPKPKNIFEEARTLMEDAHNSQPSGYIAEGGHVFIDDGKVTDLGEIRVHGPVNEAPAGEPIPVATGTTGKVKSDGGSSSYYDIPLPDELMDKLFDRWDEGKAYIRTEELIRYAFSNDFDWGTALKSMVRGHAITHLGGGKAGNDIGYECNKIDWSINKVREAYSE